VFYDVDHTTTEVAVYVPPFTMADDTMVDYAAFRGPFVYNQFRRLDETGEGLNKRRTWG
jgi:hypothetical protein